MPSDPGEPDRPVPAEAVATLRERVSGSVIVRGDGAYQQAPRRCGTATGSSRPA